MIRTATGTVIAVGALLDGVPESAVIGVSLLGGGGVGLATVAATSPTCPRGSPAPPV